MRARWRNWLPRPAIPAETRWRKPLRYTRRLPNFRRKNWGGPGRAWRRSTNTVRLRFLRSHGALAQLDALGIAAASPQAEMIQAIVASDYEDAREAIETLAALDALDIDDPAALGAQFRIVGRMYEAEYLTGSSVNAALDEQLDDALRQHLVIRRPRQSCLDRRRPRRPDLRHPQE